MKYLGIFRIVLIIIAFLTSNSLTYAQKNSNSSTKSKTNATTKTTTKTKTQTQTTSNKSNNTIAVKYPKITYTQSKWLDSLLRVKMPEYEKIFNNPSKYRFQLIYTQINRNSENNPTLKHHVWRLDSLEYFYPASLMKLPVSLLALDKINSLNISGLTKHTPMRMKNTGPCQQNSDKDDTNLDKQELTVEHCIKKIFLISDNPAYDRLYEFLGPKAIRDSLLNMGYDVRITQRIGSNCTLEDNHKTNAFEFFVGDSIIYREDSKDYKDTLKNKDLNGILVGKSSWSAYGYTNKPMDFTYYSHIPLENLHEMLMSVVMPKALPAKKRFNLKQNDRIFLLKHMSMYPSESDNPSFSDPKKYKYYENGRMKYFIYGGKGQDTIPGLRIYNKVGMAIGFLTDVAYIVDFKNNCEFFLSARVFVNEDEVMGDDVYEYEKLGLPFLKKLGETLLEYEKTRKRTIKPNLTPYRFQYQNN